MTLIEVIKLCEARFVDTVVAGMVVATVLGGLRKIGAAPGQKGWLDVTRLPQRYQPLVPMALTTAVLLWTALDSGLVAHKAAIVAALVM